MIITHVIPKSMHEKCGLTHLMSKETKTERINWLFLQKARQW